MKAIVLAGSKGIGKGISDELKTICDEVISTSSKDLDTSNIKEVERFANKNPHTDILVLYHLQFYRLRHGCLEEK